MGELFPLNLRRAFKNRQIYLVMLACGALVERADSRSALVEVMRE